MANNNNNMKYTLLQKQDKGTSLRLTFSITNPWVDNVRRHVITDTYKLDGIRIRFKFQQVYVKSVSNFISYKISTRFSADHCIDCKRLPFALTKDSSVQIIIKSKIGNFEKKIDTNDWSDWSTIGKKSGKIANQVLTVDPLDMLIVINKRAAVSFANLYDDDELTDFYLSTPTDKIAVHKACLAAYSDVFKAMLSKEWKETAEGQLKIPGATLKTLEYLKKYIYLGSLPDDNDMLKQLLVFASCYMMESLKTECITELTYQATRENLHNTLRFACENNIPDLVIAMLEQTPDKVIKEAHKKALEENKPEPEESSDDSSTSDESEFN